MLKNDEPTYNFVVVPTEQQTTVYLHDDYEAVLSDGSHVLLPAGTRLLSRSNSASAVEREADSCYDPDEVRPLDYYHRR